MIRFYINFLTETFDSDFSKRFLVVLFLPNILVLGFWENDLTANGFWNGFLKPYLNIEIYIFYFIFGSVVVVDFMWPFLEFVLTESNKIDGSRSKPRARSEIPSVDPTPVRIPTKEEIAESYARVQEYHRPIEANKPKPPEPELIQPKVIEVPKPTSAEIKRKALRDITGRGA